MTRVAIPVFGTRISSRLDCAEIFVWVTIEDGAVKSRETFRAGMPDSDIPAGERSTIISRGSAGMKKKLRDRAESSDDRPS
jgi:hypothetical protein